MDICNSLDSRCGPRLVGALTLVRIDEILRDSCIIQLTIDKIICYFCMIFTCQLMIWFM
jgi:hypothetical protein